MSTLTSAGGLLALLEEPSDNLKVHALKALNNIVHSYWAEIASSVALMYVLGTSTGFCSPDSDSITKDLIVYAVRHFLRTKGFLRESLRHLLLLRCSFIWASLATPLRTLWVPESFSTCERRLSSL